MATKKRTWSEWERGKAIKKKKKAGERGMRCEFLRSGDEAGIKNIFQRLFKIRSPHVVQGDWLIEYTVYFKRVFPFSFGRFIWRLRIFRYHVSNRCRFTGDRQLSLRRHSDQPTLCITLYSTLGAYTWIVIYISLNNYITLYITIYHYILSDHLTIILII